MPDDLVVPDAAGLLRRAAVATAALSGVGKRVTAALSRSNKWPLRFHAPWQREDIAKGTRRQPHHFSHAAYRRSSSSLSETRRHRADGSKCQRPLLAARHYSVAARHPSMTVQAQRDRPGQQKPEDCPQCGL
jgi:hypothetical protein